jgi:hypothetical protein
MAKKNYKNNHPQKKGDEITQIHHSDYTTEFLQAKKVFGQKDE